MKTNLRGGLPAQVLVSVVLIVIALAATYLLTRSAPAPQAADSGHVHGQSGGAGASGPVTIAPEVARRIGVTYAEATRGSLAAEISTVGELVYDETRVRTISPRIDGWVEELFVNFTGQDVRVGAPLLRIHSPMLVTAQEELLLAVRLVREVAGGTAEAKRAAEDLVESARRRLAFWEIPAADIARIVETGAVTRTMTLRSSVSGVVVEKNVDAGQRVMMGDALFRVADLGTVWVEGELYERDLAAVRLGSAATVTFEAYPGERWTGTVTYLYPTVDPATRTARVRVALRNPSGRLKPGMYATVRLPGTRRQDVVSIPRTALLASGARSLVFVRREDGQLEPREVTVGLTSVDRVEVLRGLVAGDTVVASATFLVDAESNLRAALGAMANVPGKETGTPADAPDPGRKREVSSPKPKPPVPDHGDHAGHDTVTMGRSR